MSGVAKFFSDGRKPARVALAVLSLALCGSCRYGGGQPEDETIDSWFRGPWMRIDNGRNLYVSAEAVYVRDYDSWIELQLTSATDTELVIVDNGLVIRDSIGSPSAGAGFYLYRMEEYGTEWLRAWIPDPYIYRGSLLFARAGGKTSSFAGSLMKDESLLGAARGPSKALVPAGGISLVIRNLLDEMDSTRVTTLLGTGNFTASGIYLNGSYAVADSRSGLSMAVRLDHNGENIGIISVPRTQYNFKTYYSLTPTSFFPGGIATMDYMVAGSEYTSDMDGINDPFYYEIVLSVRNTGEGEAPSLTYGLDPSAGLDFRNDSAPLIGTLEGPIAPRAASQLKLYLRRPLGIDPGKDSVMETIAISIMDASNNLWQDSVELVFWRKSLALAIHGLDGVAYLLGHIMGPEGEKTGGTFGRVNDGTMSRRLLPYRREGYTIGIYPDQGGDWIEGSVKYAIAAEVEMFGGESTEFINALQDRNEPNDSAALATPLGLGEILYGIVGPDDADYFKTLEEAPASGDNVPPGSVTNLVATAGDGTITLTWTNPGDADLDHIKVSGYDYAPMIPSGGWFFGARFNVTVQGAETWTASNLVNGMPYQYRLCAVDSAGNESVGSWATATPSSP